MTGGYALRVEIRSLGFSTDLMIRVLEGGNVTDQGDYLVIRSPRNPLYWWGNFLLVRQLAPATGPLWLERFAAEFPGAEHVAIGVDATDAAVLHAAALADPAGLIGCGLRLDVDAVLTAHELREPPYVNTDAVIRPLRGKDDWQQAAELRTVVSADGPGGDPQFAASRVAAERAICEAGHATWYGAFLDDALMAQLGIVTGNGLSGPDRLARYQNVETHPSARGRGLASTLVWQAGQETLSKGNADTLVIVADPDYHAIGIYMSLGFTVTQHQISFARHPTD